MNEIIEQSKVVAEKIKSAIADGKLTPLEILQIAIAIAKLLIELEDLIPGRSQSPEQQ